MVNLVALLEVQSLRDEIVSLEIAGDISTPNSESPSRLRLISKHYGN
jgi:hypothetical protein